jgi:predicted transcriptional regulator
MFRSQAATRILDFLLNLPQIELTKARIAKESKVSWETVNSYMPILLKYKILTKNKNGKFKINENAEMTKALISVDFLISEKYWPK